MTPNAPPAPSKKEEGVVTFCVIKITSLMEVTMILNKKVLTSLCTVKGIAELENNLFSLMSKPPPSLLLMARR